jgi:DDE superfamily endonuclease
MARRAAIDRRRAPACILRHMRRHLHRAQFVDKILGVISFVGRPHGVTVRNLAWALGIPRHLKVYPVDVRLLWPVARRGRPRRRHVPDILSMPAEDLAGAKWQTVSWRTGTKGKLKARFAAVRVRTADGPPQRIRDKGQQHLPGDEAWLIGEHRSSGEKKYYLANLPAATSLRTLAATIKARWICEQAHQQLKEELGLITSKGDPGKVSTAMRS